MKPGRKAVLATVVLLAAMMAAEVLARAVVPEPTRPFVASRNPRLIYELHPAYPGINSLGMRQGELDPVRLRHDFVIAAIGDSHTYGADVPIGALSFPARLEHHLRVSGRAVTVLNLGVPGYNMVQELEVLRAKALGFAPDLVVLQYTVNDDHISNFIQPAHPRLNRLMHASVLVTGLWTGVVYSGPGRRYLLPYVETYAPDLLLFAPGLVGTPMSRERDPQHGPTHPTRSRELVPARYHEFIGRQNLEDAVRTFGELCRAAHIPVLATGFIETADRHLYDEAGFEVYSFFQMFEGRDIRGYGYDPARTDSHFSVRGNDFIGQALAEYVRAHHVLHPRRRAASAG